MKEGKGSEGSGRRGGWWVHSWGGPGYAGSGCVLVARACGFSVSTLLAGRAGGPGAIIRAIVDLSRRSSLSSLSALAGRHALRGPRRVSSTVVDVSRFCAQSLTRDR